MIGVSASLSCMDFGFLMETDVHQTDDFQCVPRLAGWGDCLRAQVAGGGSTLKMCRGSNVKDSSVTSFQLESLILAQNERWRQA